NNNFNNNEFYNNERYNFFDFLYKYILNIFYLFNNILGSMHNEKHTGMHNDKKECGKVGANGQVLGVRGVKDGLIYGNGPPNSDPNNDNNPINNKEMPNDYERVRQLKIKQFKKLLELGWDLPKNIMDEYNLWQYLEEIKKKENKEPTYEDTNRKDEKYNNENNKIKSGI
ncbi:MAG: hypothetical protein RMJ34_07700, partial [candidate division WOR-3 bacterium]|nr:hypothetical protein [candidate division WOR-3 bacterium]